MEPANRHREREDTTVSPVPGKVSIAESSITQKTEELPAYLLEGTTKDTQEGKRRLKWFRLILGRDLPDNPKDEHDLAEAKEILKTATSRKAGLTRLLLGGAPLKLHQARPTGQAIQEPPGRHPRGVTFSSSQPKKRGGIDQGQDQPDMPHVKKVARGNNHYPDKGGGTPTQVTPRTLEPVAVGSQHRPDSYLPGRGSSHSSLSVVNQAGDIKGEVGSWPGRSTPNSAACTPPAQVTPRAPGPSSHTKPWRASWEQLGQSVNHTESRGSNVPSPGEVNPSGGRTQSSSSACIPVWDCEDPVGPWSSMSAPTLEGYGPPIQVTPRAPGPSSQHNSDRSLWHLEPNVTDAVYRGQTAPPSGNADMSPVEDKGPWQRITVPAKDAQHWDTYFYLSQSTGVASFLPRQLSDLGWWRLQSKTMLGAPLYYFNQHTQQKTWEAPLPPSQF